MSTGIDCNVEKLAEACGHERKATMGWIDGHRRILSMITFEGIIYILAISLQLAGAELLIISYWSKPFQKLIKEELDKQPHVGMAGTTFYPGGSSEQEISTDIWLNRFAFILIALGYVVGIFGDIQNCSKWLILVLVVAVSVSIAKISDFVAKNMTILFSLCNGDKGDKKVGRKGIPKS